MFSAVEILFGDWFLDPSIIFIYDDEECKEVFLSCKFFFSSAILSIFPFAFGESEISYKFPYVWQAEIQMHAYLSLQKLLSSLEKREAMFIQG